MVRSSGLGLLAGALLLGAFAGCAEGKARFDAGDVDATSNPNIDAAPGSPDAFVVPTYDSSAGPQAITISHSTSQTITDANSVSCNGGDPDFFHSENSYYRVFALAQFSITSALSITSVDVGIEDASGATGSQSATLRLHTLSGTPLLANMSQIGSAAVTIPDQTLSVYNIPISATAPAGSTLVVELNTPDGAPGSNRFFIGSNGLGESAPGYLVATDCSVTELTTTTAAGFPDMHIVMNVNGTHTP